MKTRLKIFLAASLLALSALSADAAPATVTTRPVDLAYPRVQGLGAADAAINRTLTGEIDAFADTLRQPDHSGKVDYRVELNDGRHFSITVTEMQYVYRAAHPMTYLRAFTFEAQSGSRLALEDLFLPGSDYRSALGQRLKVQIAERQIPIFPFTPFAGIKDNQEYYLTNDALVVYYQLYEFTPYAWGFLKFTIPYKDIADILRPEFMPTDHLQ